MATNAPSHVSFNTKLDVHPHINAASNSSDSLVILDPSPENSPASPDSPQLPPLCSSLINEPFSDQTASTSDRSSMSDLVGMGFRKSMVNDLENVLEIDSPQFKGVNFMPHSPTQMNYRVSHNMRQSQLRTVGPLFPDEDMVESPKLQQDIVSNDKRLQAAAANATVCDCESDQHDEKEGDSESAASSPTGTSKRKRKKSKSKKKKKKSKPAATPRTGQLITVYMKQNKRKSKEDFKFDRISVTESNQKTVLISSKGYTKGTHEWTIEILKCDVDLVRGVI